MLTLLKVAAFVVIAGLALYGLVYWLAGKLLNWQGWGK